MKSGALFGFAAICLSSAAFAAETSEPFPSIFAQGLRQGRTLEAFLQAAMQPFRQAAGGSSELTRELIDRRAAQGENARKAMFLGQFVELDKNRDGRVVRAEAEAQAALPGDRRSALSSGRVATMLAETLFAADADKDGTVSLSEAYAHAEPEKLRADADNSLAEYLAIGDGAKVSAAQVLKRANDIFRSLDADGDTILSDEELAKVAALLPSAAKRRLENYRADIYRAGQGCRFPAPSAAAETILLGAYEGDAMADVHVGDPHEETTSSNITIQPGKTPLYIVVASYEAQIWAVSGAVERVEKLVVAGPGGRRRSGVVGLEKERVEFAGGSGRPCMRYFYESGTRETAEARGAFEQTVGAEADRVGGAYSISNVLVPDMTFVNLAPRGQSPAAPEGFEAEGWNSGMRFTPRGLVRFEPDSVVSTEPAKRYDVLPQEFGLSQLVDGGQLERLSSGMFRIARPIAHFPAGLAGAHAVSFMLGKGVPMPAGNPGHSCVLSEETGESVGGPSGLCRARQPQPVPEGEFK